MEEDLIYHYTNFSAFHGVINSQELWATSIHYLNDSSEFIHAIKLCKEQITKSGSTKLKKLNEELDRTSGIYIFVASFSKEPDLLSQWRAYCRPNGVAIGFSREQLIEIGKRHTIEIQRRPGYVLLDCIYDEGQKKEKIGHLLDEYEDSSQSIQDATTNFLYQFCTIGASFKDSCFQEEREVRLISPPTPNTDKRCGIRPATSVLIPYYRLNLGVLARQEKNKQDIGLRKVTVGPNPNRDLAVNSITNYLHNRGVAWQQVGWSAIPYRDLV